MIKTTILAATILFAATMMVQEVYAAEPQSADFNISGSGVIGQAIPDWVKTQFEWYVNEEIDEKTLLTSMNWMFDNNVMHLSEKAAIEVQQMKEENNDLKLQVEELQAAIAIPNLIEARKGANESTDTGSGGDITMQGGSEGTVDTSTTDEFGKVKVQFHWGTTQEDIDQYIDKMKKSIDYLPPEQQSQAISSLRTLVTTQTMHNTGDGTSETFTWSSNGLPAVSFASVTIDNIMTKGGTVSVWEDGIAAFSKQGMHASVVEELQGIAVLCNTEIDKKSQTIDAELKMIEEWLKIIEEKQTTDTAGTSTDYYGRTTTETSTTNYNQSDLDFITRKLVHIDQQINSLDTGIKVLQDKLKSAGDDAQLTNIDLQNSLQKQQQTLQMLSNIMKTQHESVKAMVNNMR